MVVVGLGSTVGNAGRWGASSVVGMIVLLLPQRGQSRRSGETRRFFYSRIVVGRRCCIGRSVVNAIRTGMMERMRIHDFSCTSSQFFEICPVHVVAVFRNFFFSARTGLSLCSGDWENRWVSFLFS